MNLPEKTRSTRSARSARSVQLERRGRAHGPTDCVPTSSQFGRR